MRILPLIVLIACSQDYEIDQGQDPLRPTDDDRMPSEPGPFDLDGDGQVDGDHFDLAAYNPTDIVIYGDTSGSMTDELVTMGQNILRFTDRLLFNGGDWRILVVTGATGCGVDGWFEPDSADFEPRIAQALITKPENTDLDEMGLQNVRNAISQADGGCNAGFLREQAMLHVIFISDENDESPGFEQPDYWRDYVDTIIDMKGSAARTRFSAVAGPVPDGCANADPGFGYDEVVDATNGEFISICSNWPNQLDVLADASLTTELFPLSEVPVVASIKPYVNGDVRENGWVFEADENAVRFTVDPPMTGDVVDIFYTPVP